MENLITTADFKDFHTLPQLAVNGVSYTSNITMLQEKFLIDLLGYNFYHDLKTAYDNSELEENPIALDPKWSTLLNGDDVVIDNLTYRFDGYKKALIQYCWVMITASAMIGISSNGMYVANSDNSLRLDPIIKLTDEWNVICDLLESDITIFDYIDSIGTYPTYIKSDKLGRRSWL